MTPKFAEQIPHSQVQYVRDVRDRLYAPDTHVKDPGINLTRPKGVRGGEQKGEATKLPYEDGAIPLEETSRALTILKDLLVGHYGVRCEALTNTRRSTVFTDRILSIGMYVAHRKLGIPDEIAAEAFGRRNADTVHKRVRHVTDWMRDDPELKARTATLNLDVRIRMRTRA